MQSLNAVDELTKIRAELARLHAREASLCAALQPSALNQSPAMPSPRPGWPIRRGVALHEGGLRII